MLAIRKRRVTQLKNDDGTEPHDFGVGARISCISDFIDNQFGHSGGQWQPVVLFLDFDPGASNIDKRFFIFHWCINVCFCYTRIAYW